MKKNIKYKSIISDLSLGLRDKDRQIKLKERDYKNCNLKLDKEITLSSKKDEKIKILDDLNVTLEKENRRLKRQKAWAYVKGGTIGVGIGIGIYGIITMIR